jgi:predicted nucleic acid-binding protein
VDEAHRSQTASALPGTSTQAVAWREDAPAVLEELAKDPELWTAGYWSLRGVEPRPVVVDANVLRGEILRVVRCGGKTFLLTLAAVEWLRIFAATHVIDEVSEHLPEWAVDGNVALADAARVWRDEFAPLITRADLDVRWLSAGEQERVAALALPVTGDPDDVPTAVAALALRAALLSTDKKVLRAVYGDDFNLDRHKRYATALRSGGLSALVDRQGRGARVMVNVAGLGVAQLAAMVRRSPMTWWSAAAVAVPAVVVLRGPGRQHARKALARIGGALAAAAQHVTALVELRVEFRAAFDALAVPISDPGKAPLPPEAVQDRDRALAALWEAAPGVTVHPDPA